MFIEQWGTQILYEKLKATNKTDEYITKLRTFKLDKQVEFEKRQEQWNGDKRDNINLFNCSIRSEILVPYRKRRAEREYEVFLNSCPKAIRKWIANDDDDEDDDEDDDDDDDDDGARCLDNHDVDVLAEDASSANQSTSHSAKTSTPSSSRLSRQRVIEEKIYTRKRQGFGCEGYLGQIHPHSLPTFLAKS